MEKIKKYALLPVFFGLPFLLHPINNLFLRATGTPVSKLYDINNEHVFFFVLIAIAGFLLYRFLLSDLQKNKFFSWSKFSLALFLLISLNFLNFPLPLGAGESSAFHFVMAFPLVIFAPQSIGGTIDISKTIVLLIISIISFIPFYLLGWLVFKGLQKIRFSQNTLHITILIFFILVCIIANPEFVLRGIEL